MCEFESRSKSFSFSRLKSEPRGLLATSAPGHGGDLKSIFGGGRSYTDRKTSSACIGDSKVRERRSST